MRQSRKDVNEHIRKYRLTPVGFIKKTYKDMRSRIRRNEKYIGLNLCDMDTFIDWSLNHSNFIEVFNSWDKKCRKSCPSIDRIDNSIGYEKGNMQWITLSENAKKRNKEFHKTHISIHNEKGHIIKYEKK